MKLHKYTFMDKIIWEKTTVNDKPVNGNGWVTRHSTETLLIFSRGEVAKISNYHNARELVRAERRKGSLKPEEVVKEVLTLVPNEHYLEVYARVENCRPNFVSVGNQVKATEMTDKPADE